MNSIRMRGKKGEPHLDPQDPPRRRANKRRGHGTYKGDRPPLVQIISRQTKELRIVMVHNANRKNLEPLVQKHVPCGATVRLNTDEWRAYAKVYHSSDSQPLHQGMGQRR